MTHASPASSPSRRPYGSDCRARRRAYGCPAAAVHAAPLRIGMTFQELNNPYFVTMQKALNDAAASIGAQVVVTDAHHDVSKQVSDVEDMLQKKIDILLVNPTDSTGIQSAITQAKKAGAVVVAVDANANGPVDSFVGSKNYDAGVMSCDYLAKAIGGSGEVAILDGIPVVPILERVRGCKAGNREIPEREAGRYAERQAGARDRAVGHGKHDLRASEPEGHLQRERRRRDGNRSPRSRVRARTSS